MPFRRLPDSVPTVPTVLHTLRTARDRWFNTPVAADRAITAAQFAQLDPAASPDSLLKRLEKEVGDVDTALALQVPLTTDLEQKAARLTMLVSHFHQVLDLGIVRGTFAAGARAYYGRDVGLDRQPFMGTYDELETAAAQVVSGEVARLNAETTGHVSMALPSAGEVEAALNAFRTARTQSTTAIQHTGTEREEVGTLLPAALELAVDLCDTVEFFYRKDPSPSSRRVKCRRWGVVYTSAAGEPPDPEPEPEPEPPAPPPPTP